MLKIRIMDNTIFIKPFLSWMPDFFTCKRTVMDHSRRPPKFTTQEEPFFAHEENGDIGVVPSGMLSKLTFELKAREVSFEVIDLRAATLLDAGAIYFDRIQPLREYQDDFLFNFFTNREGIFKGATALGKSYCIRQLCRSLLDERIMVTTKKLSVIRQLHRDFIDNDVDACIVDGKHDFEKDHAVIVVSSRSLRKIPDDWPTIMIVDECHRAGAPNFFEELLSFNKCMRFGFSATPLDRSDNANILITALFGDMLTDVSYSKASKAGLVVPIEVEVYPVGGGFVRRTQTVAKERMNIWRNKTRNKTIAKSVSRFGKSQKVLILCKTIDHLIHLKQFLPEYTLVFDDLDETRYKTYLKQKLITEDFQLDIDVDDMLQKFKDGTITKVIATPMWSEGVDVPDLVAIVRGDGMSSTIFSTQASGRVSRLFEGKEKGVLIDFYDKFEEGYKNKSKKRFKGYEKEGWHIVYK